MNLCENMSEEYVDMTKSNKISGEDILRATEGLYFVNLVGISRAIIEE